MMIICLQTFEYSNRNFIRIAHAMLIRFDSFFQLKKRKRRMRRIKKRIERIHSKCELMRKLIRNENFVSFFVFLFCFFDDIYFNFVKCIDRSIRMNLFFFSSKYIKSLVFSVLNFQLRTNKQQVKNK